MSESVCVSRIFLSRGPQDKCIEPLLAERALWKAEGPEPLPGGLGVGVGLELNSHRRSSGGEWAEVAKPLLLFFHVGSWS